MTLASTTPAGPALSVRDLRIEHRKDGQTRTLVEGVSFDVEVGEIVGLIGESGSGKTLTAKSVLRMLPDNVAAQGRIHVAGRDVLDLSDRELRRLRGRDISAVFQDPLSSLNPVMRVGDQVIEAIQAHGGVARGAARARAQELLASVGIRDAETRMRQYPHEFSGGMRQRVCIAMAIAQSPGLLIADEPTTAVDVTVQAQILRNLLQLRRDLNLSMLLITHDIGVVAQTCDRVVVMRDGGIVETGVTEQVLNDPQAPYTRELIAAVPSIDDAPPVRRPVQGAPVVEARNVRVTVGRGRRASTILHETSLSISPGETVGLVGESGSGKTTLARTIAGFLAPSDGAVLLNGELVGGSSESRGGLRREVQYVFQDPYASLDPTMTIRKSLEEALAFGGVSAPEWDDAAQGLMGDVGLDPEMLDRRPRAFSGGQRQRIVIARALAVKPRVLVCDEAVSALDVSVQARVLAMLQDLQRHTDIGILFISHDLAVVRSISDRVVVMKSGEIVESGSAEQIYSAPQTEYTRTLLASSLTIRARSLENAQLPVAADNEFAPDDLYRVPDDVIYANEGHQ